MKHHALGADDLIRALADLRPRDEKTLRAVADALGFELVAIEKGLQSRKVQRKQPAGRPWRSPESEQQQPTQREQAFNLVAQEAGNWSAKPQSTTVPRAKPLPKGAPEDTLPRPRFEPLLRRSGERAVVSTMLRTRLRAGPPSITELVEAATQIKPLHDLPASWQERVEGVDVLLDVGDNMVVFGRDQEWLLSLILRVVGEGKVNVLCFSGSPERGVTSEADFVNRTYQPPRPGWPILMLTDLGIGSDQSGRNAVPASEWQDFARRIRAAQCHLIALVPYPRRRWPRLRSGTLDIIQWDRSTGVGAVRSAIGRARRG